MEFVRGPAEAELVDVERGQPLAPDCELTRDQKLQLYRVGHPARGVADAPRVPHCPSGSLTDGVVLRAGRLHRAQGARGNPIRPQRSGAADRP